MEVETYFLRYAFPCAFIIKSRGEIDDNTMKMLEEAAIENTRVDREILEKVFWRAFKRISVLAEEMGKGKWDFEVIKKYFRQRHNEEIEKGIHFYEKAPESLKELSKVLEAEIVDKKQGFLIVRYNGKKRTVSSSFVPHAEIGDKVTIHYGFAVDKLS